MNTKEKIANKAKELFNNFGYSDTSLRQIANALNISQGNLNYHFKKKHDLLEFLYFDLVDKMDSQVGLMLGQVSLLSQIYTSSGESMQIFYDYRFLFRDMYAIFRSNENLKQHYLHLQEKRKMQFLQLFSMMQSLGLLREEEIECEYERLYERMNILGDNWINSLELHSNANAHKISYYQSLLFEIIFPYLTPKGKKDFLKIINP